MPVDDDRSDLRALAQAFYELVVAYVEKAANDPTRPTWEEVNSAQQRWLVAERARPDPNYELGEVEEAVRLVSFLKRDPTHEL